MGSIDTPPFLREKMKQKIQADKSDIPPFLQKKSGGEDVSNGLEKPTSPLPLVEDLHSAAWKKSQSEMAKRATEAGLPYFDNGNDRLGDAIKRSEDAGYKFKHFTNNNDPTGDRTVTIDIENLTKALKQRLSKAKDSTEKNKVSKELSYWQQELKDGMTAAEWKKQTSEADPKFSSPLPLQEGSSLISTPEEIFGVGKFSEFHKPEADAKRQRIPEWKPQSIAEAHTEDKNWSGNLWNSLVSGFASLGAGIAGVAAVVSADDVKAQRGIIEKQRETFINDFGVDVAPEEKANFEEGFVSSSIGGLVSSVPAMIFPAGIGLFAQGYDSGLQSINSTEEGAALPENYKTIFASTIGVARGALEKYGLNKIFGKVSDRVATNLASNTLRELIKKADAPITAEVFEQALTGAVKGLKKKVVDAGGKIGNAALVEFSTGAAQELSTVATELATNKLTGKPIFEDVSWQDYLGRIAYAGAQESVGGGILGTASLPFRQTRNYIAEKVATAKSPEDIVRLKEELIKTAEVKEDLSDDEKMQFEKTIDDYVRVNQKIPSDIENDRVTLSEKIIEKEDLQNEVTKKLEEVTTVDDAFKPVVRSEMEALQNRVDEVNNEIQVLSGIVEDTKTTEAVVSEDKPIEEVIQSTEVTQSDTIKENVVEETAPLAISIKDLMKQELSFEQKYKEVEFIDPITKTDVVRKMTAKSARILMEKRHAVLDKIVNCLT